MPASRRGSGSVVLPSGQTIAIHTRTQDEEDLPHATKKYVLVTHNHPGQSCPAARAVIACLSCYPSDVLRTMADHLRKYETLSVLLSVSSWKLATEPRPTLLAVSEIAVGPGIDSL
ncbi:hypothetical protein JVT61DRAFT_8347 [Boletus reticuloceps]|uniref:Uncharacterized protein n=1 Tax=Boletus reticuloceps TaxID=495285 RepID=A0A8I3AFA0_9AGAM|nr:hypothetical protein JVT61DRAFT_8347 [Boletus reticuloceps]